MTTPAQPQQAQPVAWWVRTWVTWPWQARQLKRAGFRRTGWMTWESGGTDG